MVFYGAPFIGIKQDTQALHNVFRIVLLNIHNKAYNSFFKIYVAKYMDEQIMHVII